MEDGKIGGEGDWTYRQQQQLPWPQPGWVRCHSSVEVRLQHHIDSPLTETEADNGFVSD